MSGLTIIDSFITEEEEAQLISHLPFSTTTVRAVKRYGSTLPYLSHIVSEEIPSFFNPIMERVSPTPDHVTVNNYLKGQYIPYHIDSKESGPLITVLSLLSDTILYMRKGKVINKILLPRRSLLQLQDEARWEWEHSVRAKDPRISIVFRKSTI